MSKLSEDVFFFQGFYQSPFKFIRGQITALGVGSDLQGIGNRGILLSHKVPEVPLISVTSSAGLVFLVLHGVSHHRTADRFTKLHVHVSLAFEPVDFFSEVYNFLFHLFVSRRVFC